MNLRHFMRLSITQFVPILLASAVPMAMAANAAMPLQPVNIQASIPLGSGIISPYKMLVAPDTDGDSVLVLTGGGEIFGISELHYANAKDFRDERPPLNLCSNASGFVTLGMDQVVIACRGSNELVQVNLYSWSVTTRIQLGFSPLAIAAVTQAEVVVSSIQSGDIILVGVSPSNLGIVHHVVLRKRSYALAVDREHERIFVIQPDFGVVVLDASDLAIRQVISVDGTPSFGAALWNSTLVFTEREGYLVFMSTLTGRLQRVDLAPLLGLNRATLPPRGIEPMDIVPLGDSRILVICNRQNSLVLSLSDELPYSVTAVTTALPSGAYGMIDPARSMAFITSPTSQKISTVAVPDTRDSGRWRVQSHTVGDQLQYATRFSDGGRPTLAVIDSRNNLSLVSGADALVARPLTIRGVVAIGPLIGGPDDSLLVVGNYRGTHALLWISSDERLLGHFDVGALWPVYSISRDGNHVLLVGRLKDKYALLDLKTGRFDVFDSIRSRPRAGLLLGDDRMILIHDTSPDLGYSLWSGNHMRTFVRVRKGYPTDIRSCDGGRTAVISLFDGTVIRVDTLTGTLLAQAATPDRHIMNLAPCCDGSMWGTAPDYDTAALFSPLDGLWAVARVQIPGLDYVFPLDGRGNDCDASPGSLYWAVTDTMVDIFQLAKRSFRKKDKAVCEVSDVKSRTTTKACQ